MSLVPGTRFGAYEVAALIGVGGMGEVYRATDPNLKRSVALKVLSDSFVGDPIRIARLQREAEALAALNHANVAQIYGIEKSGATTALVMELIEGPTLAERIAQGPLPPSEALGIAQQIAAALEAAHEQGIVHRDLKPANVKLRPDGTVKVLDFGIAKPLEQRAASGPQPPALTTPAMTEAGVVLGTAAYMSPEQARGLPVDKRADIWAFGCVLFEMLTGEAAFAGDDVTSTLARVLEREPDMSALPRGLAPNVRATLELCLQKAAKKRLRDIGDVRLALEGALVTPPVPESKAVVKPPFWRRALPVAAALVIGGVIVGAYERSERAAPTVAASSAARVTRFAITLPATAPLGNGSGVDVAISPDGERLAYFAQNPSTGEGALYVRELDGLEARLVPGTEGALEAASPFFSADGRSIVVALDAGRGIVRVPLDGGPRAKLLDALRGSGGHWGGDDSVLLAAFAVAGTSAIWRVSAGGRNPPEPLMPEVTLDRALFAPTLLPGGRAVLFSARAGDSNRVEVLDLASGERKAVIDGGHPTYVPTGHIVFVRQGTLMAVPFDAAELAVTGEPVAFHGVRQRADFFQADYSVSATGTLVYVPGFDSTQPRAREVLWVDRSGRAEPALREPVAGARDPSVSPDGARLALTTGISEDGDVWVYDFRDRPPLPLAFPADNRLPFWSPDATRVAFFRVGEDAGVHVVPADGSAPSPQPLRPPQQARGFLMGWLRDGDFLIVDFARLDILAMPAAPEGEIREVVATDAREVDPAPSPDGRWLAYVSDRTGDSEVWVMRYPDGVPVRVSTSGGFEPIWSADGRELFYIDDGAVMAVAVDATDEFAFAAPTELFRGPFFFDARPYTRSYAVARDGRFLMLRDAGGTGAVEAASIVVVENWFEELKQRFAQSP